MGDAFVANERSYEVPERPVLAVCADGWDPGYVDDALERGLMPRLSETLSNGGGTYVIGHAQVPTFTNPNNAAIVTGVSAAHNGIAGNHYRDQAGHEVQVTDPSFLRASTIHAAAHAAGVPALCVTAKDKLRRLLADGGVPSFSAECAHEQTLPDGTPLLDVLGIGARNPGIYDWQLSPFTIDLALAIAKRLGSLLVYASLTDFVQHSAAPGDALSDAFYAEVDAALGRALDAGFVVGLAADHGMHAKTAADGSPNVRFLDDALAAAGIGAPTRSARSPTRTSSTTRRSARSRGSTSTISTRWTVRAACWLRSRASRACSTGSPPPMHSSCPRTGSATWSCSPTSGPCSASRARRTT